MVPVFQELSLIPDLTVAENLTLAGWTRHGDPALAGVRTELSRRLAGLRKCAGTTCRG